MAISRLDEFLATIPDDDNRARMVEVLDWVAQHYPELELRIAWNQPVFTHHGTYIVGFSAASKHMAMAPERATMIRFEQVMRERGTDFGTMLACQPGDSLRAPRRLHSVPARREAGHHIVLASKVVNMPPRNNTQAPNNLYN